MTPGWLPYRYRGQEEVAWTRTETRVTWFTQQDKKGLGVVHGSRERPGGLFYLGDPGLLVEPDVLHALDRVGLGRLLVDQRIDLGIAAGIIARRPAGVILVELVVGVVDGAAREAQRNGKILAHLLRDPAGGLDRLQLGVDPDFFELVDQDRRGIPIPGDVARRHLDL